MNPAPFVFTEFANFADRLTDQFVSRTSPMTAWIDASILFSDGFCFCALSELLGVNHIVEAGTGFGGSTEMFARYFAGGTRVRRIWSVDDAVNPRWQWPLARLGIRHYSRFVWSSEKRARQLARERLAHFPHVTLVRGDAHHKISKIVAALEPDARVGVLLDGPKGEEQMILAERLFREYDAVSFVALDDIGPIFDVEHRGERFRASPYAAFSTSDRDYFDRYGWINQGRLPDRMAADPRHTGYGMGVMTRAPFIDVGKPSQDCSEPAFSGRSSA